jgi:hypothetical protein
VINPNGAGETAHSGSWYAWLDGYGTTHTDTLSQTVTVPSGCTNYTFSFWLHIDTAETTTTTAYDKLTVQAGSTTLATYSNLNHNSGYVQKSVNLASFAGQTVTIKFTGTEDSSLQTSFVIDDTALNVSGPLNGRLAGSSLPGLLPAPVSRRGERRHAGAAGTQPRRSVPAAQRELERLEPRHDVAGAGDGPGGRHGTDGMKRAGGGEPVAPADVRQRSYRRELASQPPAQMRARPAGSAPGADDPDGEATGSIRPGRGRLQARLQDVARGGQRAGPTAESAGEPVAGRDVRRRGGRVRRAGSRHGSGG